MPNLLDKITQPNDCYLGVALPLSLENLENDLLNPTSKDFAFHLKKSTYKNTADEIWNSGYGEFIKRFKNHLIEIENEGVKVKINFSQNDIHEISNYSVATIFAHSNFDLKKMELFDGLLSPESLAKKIPDSFQGIIDLTSCNSTFIHPSIKNAHPDCLVISNQNPTTLQFRTVAYKYLIKLLKKEPLNYLDAFQKIRLMLLE